MNTVLRNLIILLFGVSSAQAQKTAFATLSFAKADSIAEVYKNEPLTNVPALTQKLTKGLTTDAERFRAVYRWICNNIANDYALYARNMRKRHQYQNDSLKLQQWNSKFSAIALKKLIKHRRAICTGYAYLLQQMAKQIGISCEIVHGYARTSTTSIDENSMPNHSWNAVLLNQQWYLCDPTWAAGVPNPTTGTFTFSYNDGFFLAEPSLMAFNHFPLDTKWLLLPENPPSFTNFLETPVLYGNTFEYIHNLEFPKQMHHTLHKGETLHYQFNLIKPVASNTITLRIDAGSGIQTIKPQQLTTKNKTVSFSLTFKHRGFYDVHVYINNQIITTNTVKVTNTPEK